METDYLPFWYIEKHIYSPVFMLNGPKQALFFLLCELI